MKCKEIKNIIQFVVTLYTIRHLDNTENTYYQIKPINPDETGNRKFMPKVTIRSLLGIGMSTYYKVLMRDFNGFRYNDRILFKNEEDANRALEWTEGLRIMHKLVK